MTTQSGGNDAAPHAGGLVLAIEALREIYHGSSVTGRWLSVDDHYQAIGHNPTGPGPGYYDRDNPPAGYDAGGWIGTDNDDRNPDKQLRPCEWDAYSLEEQLSWLATCARISRRALEKLDAKLVDSTFDV
jgi:hypothetical protein